MNKKHTLKWFSILSLVLLVSLLLAPAALAYEGREGDEIVISEEETVNDDVYAGARVIIVDGTINGDLIGFAESIIVNGTINGDLLGVAPSIMINGTVKDDVRAAAASFTLGESAKVGEDFVAAAYGLETKPGSSIGRSMIYVGYQGLLAGSVAKDAKLAGEGFDLRGEIGGDVSMEVGSKQDKVDFDPRTFWQNMPPMPVVNPGLLVASEAKIGGNFTYTSRDTVEFPSSVIGGQTTHLMPKTETDTRDTVVATPQSMAISWALDNVRFLVTLIIVGLLSAWLIPAWIKRPADALQEKPMPSLGWGVVSSIAFWFVVAFAFSLVLLVGVILAALTLGGLSATAFVLGFSAIFSSVAVFLLVLCYFTQVIVSYWAGRALLKRFKPELADNIYWSVLLGVVILAIVAAIPLLGWLTKVVVSFFGLGALFLVLREMWRNRKSAAVVAPAAPLV